jgi:hypothetical protein
VWFGKTQKVVSLWLETVKMWGYVTPMGDVAYVSQKAQVSPESETAAPFPLYIGGCDRTRLVK